jgi:cytochrome c biogenesis protein CcmG/thiol:disulfide interchange protein DsbE
MRVNFRRVLVPGIVILVIVGFVGLLSVGLLMKEPLTGTSGEARVSRPASDFTLPLFNGGELTLSNLKGKPVVINFWASWCPPCRDEAPILEEVWQLYRERGVTFIGVDIQDKEEDARAYIEEFDITYPNGQDLDGRITIDYGVGGIPVTFFVDREGMIVSRWVGAINQNLLVERLEELLK